MNTEPMILPPTLRAAVVKAYQHAFSDENVSKRPRNMTFAEAMKARARWVAGAANVRDIAAQYFDGRTEQAAKLLSGLSFVVPCANERPGFRELVDAFYAAVEACEFGPVDAEPGTAKVLPLEQFIAGEFKPAPFEPEETEPAPKAKRPYIGFGINLEEDGLNVTHIAKGSPAEQAGLELHDVLLRINGDDVKTVKQFVDVAKTLKIGDRVILGIQRWEKDRSIEVVVGEAPESSS